MFKSSRYIGSKKKLLPFLEENIFSDFNSNTKFFDGFSGTSIVSQYVKETKKCFVDSADFSLYSKSMAGILNLNNNNVNYDYIENLIHKINSNQIKTNNLIKTIFSKNREGERNFFSHSNSEKIDSLRKVLFEEKNKDHKIVLEQILLKYVSDSANTTGIFGSFLKSPAKEMLINSSILEELKKQDFSFNTSNFYQKSILETLDGIDFYDVIYLDPPYNTRKYENNYHILNYIVDENFNSNQIKLNTKTALPVNSVKNDFGSKSRTKFIFEEMIKKSLKKCNQLVISYSTDGIVKQEDMEFWAEKNKFSLDTIKQSYKRYNSSNNLELLKNDSELCEILWKISF